MKFLGKEERHIKMCHRVVVKTRGNELATFHEGGTKKSNKPQRSVEFACAFLEHEQCLPTSHKTRCS
jgi:hypothetical protein